MISLVCDDGVVEVKSDFAEFHFGLVRHLVCDTTDKVTSITVPATTREMRLVIETCGLGSASQCTLTSFLQCSQLDWPDFLRRVIDSADFGGDNVTPGIRRKLQHTAVREHMSIDIIGKFGPITDDLISCAAKYGTPEFLSHFDDTLRKGECCSDMLKGALKHENIECIKYLVEHGGEVDDWGSMEFQNPAMFEYLISAGYDVSVYQVARGPNEFANFKRICDTEGVDKYAVSHAMHSGSTECLEYALDKLGVTGFAELIENGETTIECYKLLESRGCPINGIKVAAVETVECVEFLHTRGAKWTPEAIADIWGANKLECTQYLYEHGYTVWHHKFIENSCYWGYHKCVKYAAERGCPCKIKASVLAATHGHIKCLRYLLETGRPCDKTALDAAVKYSRYDCAALIRSYGIGRN